MNMDHFTSARMLAQYRELASASTPTVRRQELLRGLHEEGRSLFAYDQAPGAAGTRGAVVPDELDERREGKPSP
ncbi:hypothetical protein SAMN07250955_11560 [Arboricoccus pini]|uniref:Uncharacterized protein n=1 Tax=Arboricoccus pini TaxID=1963835 RepID=A0A212RVE9_9PROT|nr:hypothetical protein SAMN07250955_11560 [Arboricoccus pini]